MTTEPTVSVVDDDPAYLESLSLCVTLMGLKTKCFSSPYEYICQYDPTIPGCLILDVRMPKQSGLAVQEQLAKLSFRPAIIFMSAYAEVPTALRAMRQGAVDFLQKSASYDELADAIQRAIAQDERCRSALERRNAIAARFAQLTVVEKQVLGRVIQGMPNKTIASKLGVSRRTVEDRRARAMQKLEVESIPALVRVALEATFSYE